MNFGLEGRVIAVTGAGSGIGLATARLLAREKAKLCVIDYEQDRVDAAVAELENLGVEICGFALDVREEASLEDAVEHVEGKIGTPRALIAAAGVSGAAIAEDVEREDWDRILSTNATGLFLTCKAFGRRMIKAGRGEIATIGSIYGIRAQSGRAAYAASKFAVSGITKSLAVEWGRYGVRVNCVAPGLVDTPLMRQGVPQAFLEEVVKDRTPLGRMATAEDIAFASLFMVSDASRYISGVILPVDGGSTAGAFTAAGGANMSSKSLLDE